MIYLNHPILLLVAVPAWLAYRRWGYVPGARGAIRIIVLGLLLLMLCGPEVERRASAELLVLVLDRSESMPPETPRYARELIRRAEAEQRRFAVIGFGAAPIVERYPEVTRPPESNVRQVDPQRSNLHAAITLALELIPPGQPGRVLLLSDGLAQDIPSDALLGQAAAREIPIDFRHVARRRPRDVVLESVQGPTRAAIGAQVEFKLELQSDQETAATLRVSRNDRLLESQPLEIPAGKTLHHHTTVVEPGGIAFYRFEIESTGDPTPENNRWETLLEVPEQTAVLLLNLTGGSSALAQALEGSGLDVDIAPLKKVGLSLEALSRYQCCVLENVAAANLSWAAQRALAQYVKNLGGGLLITGGANSFAGGGYRLSPLEHLLPVSLRTRTDGAPRLPLTLCVVAEVGTNSLGESSDRALHSHLRTAIRALVDELQPSDRFMLIARMGELQMFQPLKRATRWEDLEGLFAGRETSSRSEMSGSLLDAALQELGTAPPGPKHLLLCVDGDQPQHPAGTTVDLLRRNWLGATTVTTVALGIHREADLPGRSQRAGVLHRLVWVEQPEQLPQIFLQDLAVRTGAGVVNRVTPLEWKLPVEPSEGAFRMRPLRPVPSYHLATLRPGAEATVVAEDNPAVPLAAQWSYGFGRVAVLLFPVRQQQNDGTGFDEFVQLQGRWVAAGLESHAMQLAPAVELSGTTATVRLPSPLWGEGSRMRGVSGPAEPPKLSVIGPNGKQTHGGLPFRRSGGGLVAQFPLEEPGIYFPLIYIADLLVSRCAPVKLPRSMEFLGQPAPSNGHAILDELGRRTGGQEWRDEIKLFDEPTFVRQSLIAPLAWAALLLLILEVADERLGVLGLLAALLGGWNSRLQPPAAGPESLAEPEADPFMKAKQRSRRRLER